MFKSVAAWALGNKVTLIAVTLLLGGAAIWWHNYKDGLREEGKQVCIQKINQATVDALERALAEERAASQKLRELAATAAAANAEARERRFALESNLRSLEAQIKRQRNTDEAYRTWSDTALPVGVAERLRSQGAGGNSDPSGEDGS